MVVAYRLGAITAFLLRTLRLVKLPYFSQPNLLVKIPATRAGLAAIEDIQMAQAIEGDVNGLVELVVRPLGQDPRQRLALDRAELGEIDLRPRQHPGECAIARRRFDCGRSGLGQSLAHETFNVLPKNPTARPCAIQLSQLEEQSGSGSTAGAPLSSRGMATRAVQ